MIPKPLDDAVTAALLACFLRIKAWGASNIFEYTETLDLSEFTPVSEIPAPEVSMETAPSPDWPNLSKDGYVCSGKRLPEGLDRKKALLAQSINSKLKADLREKLRFYVFAGDEEILLDSPWIVVSRAKSGEKMVFPFSPGNKGAALDVINGAILEIQAADKKATYLDLAKISHSSVEGSISFAEMNAARALAVTSK